MLRPAPADPAVVAQVLRLANENPIWGYLRITGAMAAIGHALSHQTIKNLLEWHGIDPAPMRKRKTDWSDFIKSHADCLLTTDFFTTEVWTACRLVTYCVLFFIHVASRKVFLAGITEIRAIKTGKRAQTDIYYLREMFGPVCDALKITGKSKNDQTYVAPMMFLPHS